MILVEWTVGITFEWGKEPTIEIEALEAKLDIQASYKGKLLYHLGCYDYIVTYNKLGKKQSLKVIDEFSKLDFNYIELRKMDSVKGEKNGK